jgi:DNA gyrase subunit B
VLSDCVSCDPAVAELFIVQAGRASELAKSARNRLTQAVLDIDNTIITARGARVEDVLDNESFRGLVCGLGVGISLGKNKDDGCVDLGHLRYGKIIIATDGSAEGTYIRTQVISLLYSFMYPVIGSGHVYTATIKEPALASEADFETLIIAPGTRRLIPLRVGATMTSTLKLNRLMEGSS